MKASDYHNLVHFEQLRRSLNPRARLLLGEGIYNGGMDTSVEGLEGHERVFMTIVCPEKLCFRELNWARAIREIKERQERLRKRSRNPKNNFDFSPNSVDIRFHNRVLEYYQYGHILFDDI